MSSMHDEHDQVWLDSIARAGIVVGCVIRQNRKYLMVQERQPKAHGLWSIPSGHVDAGETLESAMVREAKEETGFGIKIKREISIIHEAANRSVKHVYDAEIVSGDGAFDANEIMKVELLSFRQIKELHDAGKIRRRWVFDVL